MMNKIDHELKKAFALSGREIVECVVYVNNIKLAKEYFMLNNITITSELKFISALAVKTEKENIFKVANENFVSFISSSSKVTALVDVAKKIMNTKNIKTTGKGITIAVIDTGLKSHLDFSLSKNRIKKFVDLIGNKTTAYDDNGHGTFVTGVCAGSGKISNKKFSGVAPDVEIISIKALDSKGEANAVQILSAMQWIYDNHKEYNIKIVCMSFGSQPLGFNDPIMRGAEKLWNKGIIVVAAAGNSGPEFQTIKSPGVSPRIITVGGFNDNRINDDYQESFFEVAKFSSRGPAFSQIKPDLVAPSVDITSCDIKSFYTKLSGTSVATPMVAGICALLLEKYPTYSPDQIKKIIISNSKAITYNKNLEGWGYPNFKNIK